MKLIAVQPYVKVERKVSSIQQQDIEDERQIFLYEDKVMTRHREFPTNEVMDMSYRMFSDEFGLLYLHTLKGVYPYTIKSSPADFVAAFKKHIKKEL